MTMKNPTEDQRKGYMGPCALRPLKYFDVGKSFLTDSLHNLYGGAMVSILLPESRELCIKIFAAHIILFA